MTMSTTPPIIQYVGLVCHSSVEVDVTLVVFTIAESCAKVNTDEKIAKKLKINNLARLIRVEFFIILLFG